MERPQPPASQKVQRGASITRRDLFWITILTVVLFGGAYLLGIA
jgi:hypothetical protein